MGKELKRYKKSVKWYQDYFQIELNSTDESIVAPVEVWLISACCII